MEGGVQATWECPSIRAEGSFWGWMRKGSWGSGIWSDVGRLTGHSLAGQVLGIWRSGVMANGCGCLPLFF